MLIANAIRSIPGAKDIFGPGDIPVGADVNANRYLALPRERDATAVVGDGYGTSIVSLVINWYFNAFPEAQLQVTEIDARSGLAVEVAPHDLTDLLEKPNPFYGGDELMAGCIVSDIVDGNAYILKLRNNATRIAELWWLPHTLVEPIGSRDPFGPFIEWYEYRVQGKRILIPPSEIVHIRHGLDPFNPRKGISRLKGQLREIMTDEEGARFTSALVQNMGVPGLIVSPKGEEKTIGEDDANIIKIKLDQNIGASNRGRTVVMSGATDLNQFGFSPQEMNLASVRGVPEERLSAALGVPAAVVGLGTGLAQTKVGATMHELREMAAEQGLVPLWRRFAKGLNRQLTPEYQRPSRVYTLHYDTSDVRVLQEDKQKKHERTRLDVAAGILDVATGQAELGYPVDETQRIYLRGSMVVETPSGVTP